MLARAFGRQPVRHRKLLRLVPARVHRVSYALLLCSAEMIDQQITGQGRNPRLEAAPAQIECSEVPVNLDEDVLRQVLGIMRRAGKAVAKRVDAAMMRLDQFGPRGRIAIEASLYHNLPVGFQYSLCFP